MSKKKTTFGISFPDERILERAKEKAATMGLSLSGYVNQLLRRDLDMPNVFTAQQINDALASVEAEQQEKRVAKKRVH
ncbi:hypothetical protein OpiT1DRAFT_00173 [Opitutaceae bacterium TAV1]|nr:hypothetical protein OpiT1DRAFT_00173 [Opitutaceae bacterium TAV1]